MHVINGLGPAGTERMLVKLLESSTGPWEHVVVSLMEADTPLAARLSELGIPVHSLRLNRSIPNPLSALAIISLARRLRPHLIEGWLYYSNLLTNLAAVSLPGRVPIFWNIRSSLYDIKTERFRTAAGIRIGAALSRRVDAIIYNSQTGAQHHQAIGMRGKAVFIPNGFDCQVFRPDAGARQQVRAELGITDDQVLIGLIARFHPNKDHATFFKAAASVVQAHSNVRFVLLGADGTSEDPGLQKLVADHRLQPYVMLLRERIDMASFTNALDISSSSSWTEGCSNVIGEAMACGVPCVVTDVGENTYLVSDTGISVPSRNPEAFAEGLLRLIDAGASGRRQLGRAARRRIEEQFSMPTVARAYERLYEEHLASPKLVPA